MPKAVSSSLSSSKPPNQPSSSRPKPKGPSPPPLAAAAAAPKPKPKVAPRKGEATYSATIDYRADPSSYRVGRGERGVLTCQPYKDEILPLWRFATLPQAQESADSIYNKFKEYQSQGDFVGQDLARKFLQMGYTRSMRYYNNKGGIKPPGTTEGRTDYRTKQAKTAGAAGQKDEEGGEDGEEGVGEKEGDGGFVPTGEEGKKLCADAFRLLWRKVVDEDEVYGRMKKEWMRNEGKVKEGEVKEVVVGEQEGGGHSDVERGKGSKKGK